MKIGIMGGTFDPIHNAHLMLAEYAYREFALDEVWFMPNGNPPHKQSRKGGTGAAGRVHMVRLAIAGNPAFRLEEYESSRSEISYSYQTMEHFREIYPEHQFYFIIGADSLFALKEWLHPERLLKTCTILAAYRDKMNRYDRMEAKIEELNQEYQADIRLLVTPAVSTASQELRRRVKEGGSIAQDVPEAVNAYILDHHLYRDDQDPSELSDSAEGR